MLCSDSVCFVYFVQKNGARLKCSACKIIAHTHCIPALVETVKFTCKPTFRDVGPRQYREQTATHHHWVHRRNQKGKCKACNKVSYEGKGKVFYGQVPPRGESSTTKCGVNYQLLSCSNLLKYPNGEHLVAVNHNQLRTMASQTVDPIDWSHPTPSWAVPPERLVHSINRCSSATVGIRSCNLQHARQPPCLRGHSGYIAE